MDVTREELNGLGSRVSNIEKLESRVLRNEQDIQKIFSAMSEIPEQNLALTKEIADKNQKLLTKIMFAVVIAIGTATWAIVSK